MSRWGGRLLRLCLACRMIAVLVGPRDSAEKEGLGQTFLIQEPLLRSASGYFETCLNNPNFTEAASGPVVLDDTDSDIFGLVNEYIHLGSIQQKWRTFERTTAQIQGREPVNHVELLSIVEWCKVWMLADYLQILSLKDHAIWSLLHVVDFMDCRSYQMSVEDRFGGHLLRRAGGQYIKEAINAFLCLG